MTDEHITQMPTLTLEQFLEEHKHTSDPREAHPIDEDILHEVCDSKMGPILIEYDLAAIQAVAVREILPYDNDDESWITCHPQSDDVDLYPVSNERDCEGTLHYYQSQSSTFYFLLTMVKQRYDHYVEVEHVEDLVEVHTRQYLRDVHGYEGDFGGQVPNEDIDKVREPTLCNAQNDNPALRDEEPDNAHYAFTDARGLVIEEGTHPEGNVRYHDIDTLVRVLDGTDIRSGLTDDGDWTEDHAVGYLTDNYLADEDRAREAFEQYRNT